MKPWLVLAIAAGLLAFAFTGCGDFPATTCDTWGGAARCYNGHGICYVGLDVPGCQCNGDDAEETRILCAEAMGYAGPQVGYTSVTDAGTYWTRCLPDRARTWGPSPRDGLTGPAVGGAGVCDCPGNGEGEACDVAKDIYERACR